MAGIESELQSRFESEQHKAMLNVLFTANWFKSLQADRFKPFDISLQQYNILRILRGAKDKMPMQAIKGRMIDRAPNATRLTDKLIAKGLVIRERSEDDKRVIHVRISDKGLELLKAVDEMNANKGEPHLADISAEDARKLNEILDRWRG